MFLRALLEYIKPPIKVTIAVDEQTEKSNLPLISPRDAVVIHLPQPTKEYPLKNERTTYYVYRRHSWLPPTNDLHELI